MAPEARASAAERRCVEVALQVLKPGRLTLLLGPPGSGKSTLLKAVGGKLGNTSLQARAPSNSIHHGSRSTVFLSFAATY